MRRQRALRVRMAPILRLAYVDNIRKKRHFVGKSLKQILIHEALLTHELKIF